LHQLTLIAPNGGEFWRTSGKVHWSAWGTGWQDSDTVALRYSPDAGGNWYPIPGGNGLLALAGEYEWNMVGLAGGNHYMLRIEYEADATILDTSDAPFSIGGVYYVNDAYDPAEDGYCTAPGDDVNDGVSGATPKASVQAILTAYDLGSGDVVLVDTGTYLLSSDLVIPAEDGGNAAAHVRIVGSPHVHGSVLDRQIMDYSSGTCVNLSASYVDVERFVMRNAQTGVMVPGSVHRYGHRIIKNRMPGCGIIGYITHDGEIRGNICRSVLLGAGSANSAGPWIIESNTIVGGGISLTGLANYDNVVRNNIICTSGNGQMCLSVYNPSALATSNYNNLFVADGAKVGEWYASQTSTLVEWIALSGKDINSISLDPLFVDPANGDYHVKSTQSRYDQALGLPPENPNAWVTDDVLSPCIDGGDPASNVGLEPDPNGGRINMGVYGGTSEASKSPASGRWLVFEGAGRSNPLHAFEPLGWCARGWNWGPSETVHLEYSNVSGALWRVIPGTENLAYDGLSFWWDSRTVPDGGQYRFRVVANGGDPISASDNRDYTVANPLIAMIGSTPADQQTLWRSQNNILRLTFEGDIAVPNPGQVLIQEMLDNGQCGSDLSSGFIFTVENDGSGHPRILKIQESGAVLSHRKWYVIRNTGEWSGVANFTLQYVVQVGDANNDGRVLNTDIGVINAAIPSFSAADDDRRDINGDGRILNTDVGAANVNIPSFPVPKPSGH
jgi:hypothetical protein